MNPPEPAGVGLLYDTVTITAHDPRWLDQGQKYCGYLSCLLNSWAVAVEHIGSTAVPGLAAKPILDLAGGIPSAADRNRIEQVLTGDGWILRGDKGQDGGWLFVRESSPGVRLAHLHMVEHGGLQWHAYLRFRDLLISCGPARAAYATLKLQLSHRFPRDRAAYTAAKAEVVRQILAGDIPL